MTTWHLVNLDCRRRPHCGWLVLLTLLLTSGCGTTLQRSATEQLLASDAIDRTIAQIDFSLLADRKVYLDPQYILMLRTLSVRSDNSFLPLAAESRTRRHRQTISLRHASERSVRIRTM